MHLPIAPSGNARVQSIDLIRGVAIILMALDHVRDFFHYDTFFYDPTDLSQTTPALFLTRFITHFCAPVFCFLAGTSAFFVGRKKDRPTLAIWLMKRGLWLIFAEFTFIAFAWYFKINTAFIDLSVIWCLGVSMVFLAGLIFLRKQLVIPLSLFLIFGHNLFDAFRPALNGLPATLWMIFHYQGEIDLGFIRLIVVYPLMPWIGLMAMGYFFGELYVSTVDAARRKRILYVIGSALILLFLVFRVTNIYGDLRPWESQPTALYSFLSILNVTKYPPSFAFICITMGPVMFLLAAAENFRGRWTTPVITIGRVPMFFYIVHLYLIHVLAGFAAAVTGFAFSDMRLDVWIAFATHLKGYGFSLPVVYVVWIGIILMMYPLCKWYYNYKSRHNEKVWLSYI